MPTANEVAGLDSVTQLISINGIYALTAIAIFYLEWKAVRNLRKALDSDRPHFLRAHTAALWASIMLMGVSSAFWIYVKVTSSDQEHHVKGSLLNLASDTGSGGVIEDQIDPARSDVHWYRNKVDENKKPGFYSLDWLADSNRNISRLTFTFVHHFRVPAPDAFKSGREGAMNEGWPRKSFTIDLKQFGPETSIQIEYTPADDKLRPGTLWILPNEGGRRPLQWDSESPLPAGPSKQVDRHFALPWVAVAFAQDKSADAASFKDNGDYDPRLGVALRQRLNSQDLATQTAARRLLTDSGTRSFKFINDSVAQIDPSDLGASSLYYNLAMAVDQIEAGGTKAPADAHLRFALFFYFRGDYKTAAGHFELAANAKITDDKVYYYRGFAYSELADYGKSNRDFEIFIKKTSDPHLRATTYASLGSNFDEQKRYDEAVKAYRNAMRLDPKDFRAFNNLAFMYADNKNFYTRRAVLDDALTLADQALALTTTDLAPHVKDTKSWVLFRMGRYQEAQNLSAEAARVLPDNASIRHHLEEVTKAIGATKAPKEPATK